MRLFYECGNVKCKYIWKGRKPISHPARCPRCNSLDVRLLGSRKRLNI